MSVKGRLSHSVPNYSFELIGSYRKKNNVQISSLNIKLIASLVPVALLSGCATTYTAPEGASKSALLTSIDYKGHRLGLVRLQAFENDKCERNPHGTHLAVFSESKKNMRIPIVAGKEFVFTASYDVGTVTVTSTAGCAVTVAFNPDAERTYKLDFSLEADGCNFQLTELTSTGTSLSISGLRKIKPICFDQF